jgi:hypothetical protein
MDINTHENESNELISLFIQTVITGNYSDMNSDFTLPQL